MTRPESKASRASHLEAVDVFRVVTIAGVVCVHVLVVTTSPQSEFGLGFGSLIHINRELFLLLSAFVLTYAYDRRPSFRLSSFWRRRYWLVGVPYVTWTAIYCTVGGGPGRGLGDWLARFTHELATGTAWPHMYFLLLTMQLYLIFPLLLRFVRLTRNHHVLVLAASFTGQMAFTALFHYDPQSGGLLGAWQRNPDAILLSFQFYVIAGAVAAVHLDSFTSWVALHRRAVAIGVVATVAVVLGSYLADMRLGGMPAAQASEVFQPVNTIEATVYAIGLYCLGQWLATGWSDRLRRVVAFGSDASFGIFLVHPLILEGLLLLPATSGLLTAAAHLGTAPMIAIDIAAAVPLVYLLSAAAVAASRRTILSLPLTGRRASKQAWPRAAIAVLRRPLAQAASDTNAA